MAAAKEQAYSETQVNLVHEETLAYALAREANARSSLKNKVTEMVKVNLIKLLWVKSPLIALSKNTGKLGRKIEEAESKLDGPKLIVYHSSVNLLLSPRRWLLNMKKPRANSIALAKTFRNREVGSV